MSLSKPTGGSSKTTAATSETNDEKSRFSISLPKTYNYLTIVQAGSAVVFSTFLVTHLSVNILANFGGIELANKTLLLGRVYYQNNLLEPIVVFGSFCLHVASGVAKRGIRLYWKYRNLDKRELTGDVHEKVERIVTDEKNEQGQVVRQKITTKTTKTITVSYISRASELLLPFHSLIGYLLIPAVVSHSGIHRFLPKRHFGDSSMINITYVTLALKRWPKSSYLGFATLVGLTVYHVASGAPAVLRILKGATARKKTSEKQHATSSERLESSQKLLKYVRNGAIAATVGLVGGGLLVIGGKIGRENIRIPLRNEYLKVYGRVYPHSWVRY
ncbi:2521_t:CDS:1 [Ambispora gerdemannii]|uniref:2521_t:CDS:1 n=1 Tax=Ambispora gerdemannii TaxID=144530 RepID=A0A9N8V9Q0_9GLOM|nr:2521_t:CDS:1 [Ambispora gerdemannii]